MAHQIRHWRSKNSEMAWLSTLVETLQTLSPPDVRPLPCDPALLSAVKAHLARPAASHGFYGSNFSLRN